MKILSILPLTVRCAVAQSKRIVHAPIEKYVELPAIVYDRYGEPSIAVVTKNGPLFSGVFLGDGTPILRPTDV